MTNSVYIDVRLAPYILTLIHNMYRYIIVTSDLCKTDSYVQRYKCTMTNMQARCKAYYYIYQVNFLRRKLARGQFTCLMECSSNSMHCGLSGVSWNTINGICVCWMFHILIRFPQRITPTAICLRYDQYRRETNHALTHYIL